MLGLATGLDDNNDDLIQKASIKLPIAVTNIPCWFSLQLATVFEKKCCARKSTRHYFGTDAEVACTKAN